MRYRCDYFRVETNTTILSFLKEACLFFKSDDQVREWMSQELVLVDEIICTNPSQSIIAGQTVTLLTPESFEPKVNKNYSVIFEDEHILIINKPAPLPTHPSGKFYFNTLSQLLIDNGKLDVNEVHPVYRLDKETSGVIVFAKSRTVASTLQSKQKNHITNKTYIAITHNTLQPSKGIINKPLQKIDTNERRNVTIISNDGKPSITEYDVIESNPQNNYSLIQLILHTGRRHQIRAHLSYCNCPIVGDKTYEIKEKRPRDISRQFLHCSSITLQHPVSKNKQAFKAKLPNDMVSFLNRKIR